MSYCADSKKAIVKAAFPDGEVAITSYNPPIDWVTTAIDIPGTCIGRYWVTISGHEGNNYRCVGTKNWRYRTKKDGIFRGITYPTNVGSADVPIHELVEDANGVIHQTWTGAYCNTDCRNGRVTRVIFRLGIGNNPYVSLIEPDGTTNLSCEQECKFEVSDSTGIIYTRTESECPTNIRVECEEDCPPNTHCECTHNGHKCCYDSNGILIKRIQL